VTQTVRLVRAGYPDPPELDTAVSRATLQRVAEGTLPETFRLHRPGAIVAFGPRDRVEPGFAEAVAAARRHGFAAVERLAGGRAAVFHEGTIAFSWAIPDPAAREGIRPRFELLADIVVEAIRSLGIDARVGEVPGEYCAGQHSVNARGRTKLMGVGQRVVGGAAHVGGVVVVSGTDRVRDVLIPVYEALGLDWDPATAGSLEDEVPGLAWETAQEAIVAAFGRRFVLEEADLSSDVLGLAEQLRTRHTVGPAISAAG
jgi:octanoyl-[GcvH]:protein N-octanoyltransferase